MQVAKNVSLANYSTMRLGGNAAYATAVSSQQELVEALAWAKQQGVPAGIIGSGSNIVWRDEGFSGLIIVNKIKRFEIFEEDEQNVYVTVGSGENWDETVARCVEKGLTGIEALSLIPGTAGATPVQNVGAYGQEIAQTLVSVEAYDTLSSSMVTIQGIDCKFGYRTSRFKTTDRGRFFITAITLHLMKNNPQPPFYGALQHYFDDHGYRTFTPKTVRDAVIAIRRTKLPDPTVVVGRSFQHMLLLVLIDECDRMTSPINLWIILFKPWLSNNDVVALNWEDWKVQSISVRCDLDIGGGNSHIHHPYVAITELDSLLLGEWRRVEVVPLHEFLRNEVVR